MFHQPSDARLLFEGWIRDIIRRVTPGGPNALLLDEITATELLDLSYIQGAELDSAITAHAIYPQYVERTDRTSGPSAMSVTFPVELGQAEQVSVEIQVRWGQGSALQVGQGGRGRVVNPRQPIPDVLQRPLIGTTQHDLGEPNGARLRVIAGPVRAFERLVPVPIDGPDGEHETLLVCPAADLLYGFVDAAGGIVAPRDATGALVGAPTERNHLRDHTTYLWGETRESRVSLRVAWARRTAGYLTLTVTLRNVTEPREDDRANAPALAALLVPQVVVRVHGGHPDIPAQQYAAAKRAFLAFAYEEERGREASRRLYALRQSGCIATQGVLDNDEILLTTFGVLDTPREPPIPGPAIADLTASPEALLRTMNPPPTSEVRELVTQRWDIIRSILLSASRAFRMDNLHRFQWEAIQRNLGYTAARDTRPVTVIRAPTGAGKTIVFMINAAVSALCGPSPGTAILMFPTRLLNEDMFRRLTAFTLGLRGHQPTATVTGGLLMGTSDPLYRVLLDPEPGEAMHHFGSCPSCGAVGPMLAVEEAGRMVPECGHCRHRVSYMYTSFDVPAFLPDIVIATPDKLLYEATAAGYENYRVGLFGAQVRRCRACRRACPEAYLRLKPDAVRCGAFHKDTGCAGADRGPVETRPIRYIGFDEVHSLYGLAATYLSMFLADLEALQVFLSQQRDVGIRYEAATATISNEVQLLEALTRHRSDAGEIVPIPANGQEGDYFEIEDQTVRHRVVVSLPTRITARQAFIRSTLNTFDHLRGPAPDLRARIAAHTPYAEDWDFLLGYLFRKQEGTDMRRALRDMYRNAFGRDLAVEFLSGEAPKDQISQILDRALRGEIDILLANLVISLGVDIHGLNHMLMLGVPQGFTEFVQTAGRTGRGRSSGHVHIILQPFNPRDRYLYRHFHAVLSDVAGYYDVLPVKSTNLFCAGEMFGNVAKSILVALCMTPQQPRWPHAAGIRAAIGGREGQVQAGLARILCDDAELLRDVEELTRTKFRALIDELSARNAFLSEVMTAPGSDWLIRSLRGRSGSVVRVMCSDDTLMERLQGERSRGPRAAGARDDGEAEANEEGQN